MREMPHASVLLSLEAAVTSRLTYSLEGQYDDARVGKKGLYTQRVYTIGNYLPGWVSALLPSSAVTFIEDCYDCPPYTRTKVWNAFLGERLTFTIDGVVLDGVQEVDNPLELTAADLEVRQKMVVDIVEVKTPTCVDQGSHPTKVQLRTVTPANLQRGWLASTAKMAQKLITVYKVITVKVPIWGFQGRAESWIATFEETVLSEVFQQLYCWADEWYPMTLAEVRKYVEAQHTAMDWSKEKKGEDEVDDGLDHSIQILSESDASRDDNLESESSSRQERKNGDSGVALPRSPSVKKAAVNAKS